MNQSVEQHNAGQAPARRFGAVVAIVIVSCACVFFVGIWYLFAKDGVKILGDSISLQFNGVTTTGTVTDLEEFHGRLKGNPSTSYKLTVSFEVDGKTYSVKGSSYYSPLDRSWMGEPMPIIYDPNDPNTALIDNFDERWMTPILAAFPF